MPQLNQTTNPDNFTRDIEDVSSEGSDISDSDSDNFNDNLDLRRIRDAIAPPPVDASVQDLCKASLYIAMQTNG